ncbi:MULTISPECIES: pseudouridine synthase [Sphingobacterium]|jgi:tRNA pseudouridine65 synthase|uniref:Pseudouridine synthase n=1 Tax=Sphingobacterium thalpophilum TaxID=259 RepID=A0ACD5C380_9SPHI|nr:MULTISPECIES: pseudouridine synthase [Sphingobacterium]HAF36406.1 pseudouridylate synthase [Sphingobacterium sp.]OFV18468.1 pseudouridylate synthase [Sphingobacterium sp. HMSC13C05]OJZ13318.1 MAG: pseudouridylate synthase [Sphingobacterium sp. 40-24]HAT93941.1 pseudouridylate synthase [Sphingobacterium sp.]HCX55501.1 pseudouridylate synthase [Sphingobacterium sp.]
MPLEILYQDESIVAINKPHGLLVHRSAIARDASAFALQLLRDQLGKTVYPAHRLDRKTGGILLFSLNKETDQYLQKSFQERKIDKKYLAVLRGFAPAEGLIDYPLKRDDGTVQEAQTSFRLLAQGELAVPFGKFPTARYSLVEANPITGRMHQLRRHFAHIFHPIIGDRPHGCNKQNKFWKEAYQMDTMLLHASELTFKHPLSGEDVHIKAPLQPDFIRVLEILNLNAIC